MSEFAPEQILPSISDELGLALAPELTGNNGHFNLGRLAAIGFSTAAAFAGAELATFDIPSPATASGGTNCIIGSPNYNTVACGPHSTVARHCLSAAFEPPEGVTAGYAAGSKDKYAISVVESDIHGCNPAGIRKVSVVEKLRKGPVGAFIANSNSPTVTTNYRKNIKATLEAPYNCTTDGAGSAVEVQVRQTWKPNNGWSIPGHPKLSSTRTYNLQTIC